MISLKAWPMYMMRFHMRITLLPTAPSMFQNQKLVTKPSWILDKQIRKKYDNNCTDYRPEEKCIESFVPQLTPNPEECVPKYVVDL